MTAAQIAEMASSSEPEMIALAYEEAAGGDARRALLQAIDDILSLEAELATAERRILYGYVHGAVPGQGV